MAFLILMTACYSYQEVLSSEKYNLKEEDRVTLIAQGRKYEDAKVKSVTDSTVILVHHGYKYEIQMDDISELRLRDYEGGNKVVHNTSFVVIFYWMFLFFIVG